MLLISALARVLAKDNRICELRKRNRQLRILRSASTTRRINNYKDFPAERALDDRNNRRKHEENTRLQNQKIDEPSDAGEDQALARLAIVELAGPGNEEAKHGGERGSFPGRRWFWRGACSSRGGRFGNRREFRHVETAE